MFAHAVRDDGGEVTDFRVEHVSDGFRDPAGRGPAELAGRQLLELYPEAALAGGLFDGCVQALATRRAAVRVRRVAAAPDRRRRRRCRAPAVRIARLYDGVVIAWRRADDADRLATLLQHAQRLGRIGSWEENLRTGEVHWTEPTFALFGQPPGDPVPIADLHSHVPADDIPVVQGFRDALLAERRESAAAFRVVRADDGSVRQIRAYAEPVIDPAGAVIAVRGAYQDRVGRLPHPGGVRRRPRAAGRHRGARGGGASPRDAAAAGHHPPVGGAGGGGRAGRGGAVPAVRAGQPGQRRLVRHGAAAEQGSARWWWGTSPGTAWTR